MVAAPAAERASEFRYWARALNRQCRRFRDDLALVGARTLALRRAPTLEELARGRATRPRARPRQTGVRQPDRVAAEAAGGSSTV